jgi:hypothetical protein
MGVRPALVEASGVRQCSGEVAKSEGREGT